jgi:hypothetical protein
MVAERAGVKPWPVMVNAKSETELKKELPAPSGLIRNPKQTTDSVKK